MFCACSPFVVTVYTKNLGTGGMFCMAHAEYDVKFYFPIRENFFTNEIKHLHAIFYQNILQIMQYHSYVAQPYNNMPYVGCQVGKM